MSNKYIVYSSGDINPDFLKEKVVLDLSHLFRQPIEKISSTLVNGTPKRIKTFPSKEHADNLIATLRKIGLNCYITEVDVNEGKQSSSLTLSNKARTWSKWAALLVVLGALIAMVAYYYSAPLRSSPPPKELEAVESALLMTSQPAALIYTNFKKFKSVLQLGEQSVAHSKIAKPLTFFDFSALLGTSKYLFEQTDYGLVRIDIDVSAKNDGASTAPSDIMHTVTVLLGSYKKTEVLAAFKENYSVTKLPEGSFHLKQLYIDVDGYQCPADKGDTQEISEFFLDIEQQIVVFSSSLSALEKFRQPVGEPVASPQFSEWKKFRGSSIAALQLSNQSILDNDMMGHIFKNAIGMQNGIEQVKMRADLAPLARGVKLVLSVNGSDKSGLSDVAAKLSKSIEEVSTESKKALPSVSQLLSRITVSSDEALHVGVTFDKTLLNEFQGLVGNITSLVFGGFRPSLMNETDGSVVKERLNNSVWDYSNNAKFDFTQSYQVSNFDRYKPVFNKDGVAIFIQSLGIKPISPFISEGQSPELMMQLELEARRNIPDVSNVNGWWDSGVKFSFSVDEVIGRDGESLLLDERCIKFKQHREKNHELAEQVSFSNQSMMVSKTLRLIDGAKSNEITKVVGVVTTSVPTKVKKVNLTVGADNVIDLDGGRFQLTGINSNEVSYQLFDSDENFVAINALNKNGQTLARNGSMSSDGHVASRFEGVVESVDIYIAEEIMTEAMNFELVSLSPEPIERPHYFTSNTVQETLTYQESDAAALLNRLEISVLSEKDKSEVENKLQWSNYSLDGLADDGIGKVETESSIIYFSHDPTSSWRKRLSGLLVVPHVPSVISSSKSVYLDLMLNDQVEVVGEVEFSNNKMNGKPMPNLDLEFGEYNIGSFSIDISTDAKEISKISGQLRFEIPANVNTRVINLMPASEESELVRFRGYEYGWNSISRYELDQSLGDPLQIFGYSNDEMVYEADIKQLGDSSIIEFPTLSTLAKIELIMVDETKVITEPVSLIPAY